MMTAMNILHFVLDDSLAAHLLSALVLLLIAYLAGRALHAVFRVILHRYAAKTRTNLDDILLTAVAVKIPPLLSLFMLHLIILDLVGRPAFADNRWQIGLSISREAMFIIIAVYIGYVFIRFIDALVLWYMKDVAARTSTHLDEELAPLVNRILNLVVYLVIIVIILDHYNQNISTLIVSLGVGSLALALAAQETIANMIAGFVLMIDRPFRHSDRIRLPDGTIGNVHQIGMRSTKVIDDNNVMIITPNAEIVKSQIRNFSYPNDVVRFTVPFSVAYGTDINTMRSILLTRVNAEPDVVDPETTEVRITDLGEYAVKCDVMVRIKDPNRIPRRRGDLLQVIHDTLGAHGIEIPYPQHVLHYASPDTRGPSA